MVVGIGLITFRLHECHSLKEKRRIVKAVIARSSFADLSANAVQAKGGSQDVEVRWNRMTDAGQRAVNMGGSTGAAYFRPPLSRDAPNAEARDIRVVANLIVIPRYSYPGAAVVTVLSEIVLMAPFLWGLRDIGAPESLIEAARAHRSGQGAAQAIARRLEFLR